MYERVINIENTNELIPDGTALLPLLVFLLYYSFSRQCNGILNLFANK